MLYEEGLRRIEQDLLEKLVKAEKERDIKSQRILIRKIERINKEMESIENP